MNESGPTTIAQVEEFLSASALIEFNPGVGGPLGLVGAGGCHRGGFDLGIGADEFFDHTGSATSWRPGQICIGANRVWQKEVSTPVRGGCKKKARLNSINRARPSPREDDSR